jgi:site-specific DNA-methyltransferase (adenine-specific)
MPDTLGGFSLNAVHVGDCLELMKRLPDGCIDAVVTDPPYKSLDQDVKHGTTTRLVGRQANKRLSQDAWFPTMTTEALALVWTECLRTLKSPGALYIFADPKSALEIFPPLHPANMLVWRKPNIGMGYAWRRQYELIAYVRKGPHRPLHLAQSDMIDAPIPNPKTHPTEKPLKLLETIINNSVPVGTVILDPFAGSGSTCEAAVNSGCNFLGFELDPHWAAVANDRIAAAARGLTVAELRQGQGQLFGDKA